MADQLLDRVLIEIRRRLAASRGAREETDRLRAALAALDDSAPRARPGSGKGKTRGRKPTARRRAPRGQNLRRIRETVDQRQGATAGEVAAATGIARATVATTLAKLTQAGELERVMLPGNRVGFQPRGPADETGPSGDAVVKAPQDRTSRTG